MHKKTIFGILTALMLVLLCLSGAASADEIVAQTYPPQNGQQPPAMPAGQQPPAMPDGQQPPAMPDGQQPPAMPDGQQPPAMPDGQQPPAMPDGQQPPVMPDGQQPPVMPDGENQTTQTAVPSSPLPWLGILAGLGTVSIAMLRNRK
ncbi:MAG TPA: hypothetical protein O0X39_07405 [Methanocorpusculum sp.]|nr:hypothetical protein [Methanocorpusculum sp.]